MALDHAAFEALLDDALAQAERAARDNQPQHYQQAFVLTLQAVRMLAEESGAWRQMVARATEEYEGSEGI